MKKGKQWTILCVGESGDIASIKLSKNSLIMIGSFLGISFLCAIAALIVYAAIKVENLQLQSSLEAVKAELTSETLEKESLVAQLLIVREDLDPKQKGSKPSKKEIAPKEPESKPLKPALAKQAESLAPTTPPTVQKVPPLNIVVENFKLHKDPETNRVRYEFFLRNKQPGEKAVSGYTFVLIKPDKKDHTSWRVSPKRVLHEGRPKNFKGGQLFSIARFKIVQGYIKDTERIDYWEEAVVLVYSYSGELVLEKVFDYPKPKADTSQEANKPVQTDISISSTQAPQQTEASQQTEAPQQTETSH